MDIVKIKTYGSSVVGLAEVAIDTRSGGGVKNTAILLLEEVRPSSLGDLVGTAGVDVHDGVPEAVIHVVEGLVTKDTSVVHNDIDTAKGINGSLHNGITVLSGELGANGLATHLLDLVNDIVRIDKIVDNDGSTSAGKSQAVGAADTSTATSDEGDTAGEVNLLTRVVGPELEGLLEEGKEVVGTAGVLGVGEVGDLIPLLDDGTGGVALVGLEEKTGGALPAELGDVATTNLEDGAGLAGVVLVNKDGNERNDPLRLHEGKKIRGHNGLGHAAGSDRSNDVGENVVLDALLGEGLGEADHGELGGRVVGLAKVTEQTGSGGGVDDATELLLAEVGPGGAGGLVGALDVDLEDEVPVLILHVLEGDVAEDTGVVDEDVDAAELLDGGLDDLVAILDAVVVGDGLAASGLDLVDNHIGSLLLSVLVSIMMTVAMYGALVYGEICLPW